MAATEFVRFIGHYAHLIQFDGTNGEDVTAFLNTDTWTKDAEGRDVCAGDWLYLDHQNEPAILSNRRKRLDTMDARSNTQP